LKEVRRFFMEGSLAGRIVLQLVLIAVNAVFACAEIAVVSTNGMELEKKEERGTAAQRYCVS
jgi:putative hemolysin